MKICIIGNSHIACFKMAWSSGLSASYPNIQITFFGSVSNSLLSLTAVDGGLQSDDERLNANLKLASGGLSRIEASDYDVFLVVGLSREISDVTQDLSGEYSSAAIRQSVIDYWQSVGMTKFIKKLHLVTPKKVFAAHSPLESSATPRNPAAQPFQAFIDISNAAVFCDLNAELIAQPAETIAGGNSTHARYSSNGLRLEVKGRPEGERHESGETFHMNEQYGVLWLERFLARLTN